MIIGFGKRFTILRLGLIRDMVQDEQDAIIGLSEAEVAERIAQGKVNADTDVKTKTVRQIIAEHAFTLFNGINIIMFVLVVLTFQFKNALFMGVVISNLVIGVFQEIRAKRMVDKLSILTAKTVRVRRGSETVELPFDQLVLDDVVLLARGDQVPADAVVIAGSALLNESLLTGESVSVEKNPGSELFSGSFVDSGSVWARLTRVGHDSYAARINANAKYLKPVRSEILDTLDIIIEIASLLIFPLGIGLFLRVFLMDGSAWQDDPADRRRRNRNDPPGPRPAHVNGPRHRDDAPRDQEGARPAELLRRDARARRRALPR